MSSSKKSSKKQKKIVGGYYKKEIGSVDPQENKFDISSDDEEDEKLPDFTFLSKIPVSAQSHLILDSEQKKFQGESIISYSKYFNIDIKHLNAAIKSIPFNEIHQIRGIEWTQDELNHMKEVANVYEEQYKDLLSNSSSVASKVPQQLEKKIEELKISPSPAKVDQVKKEEAESGSKESMEKWLDDILDG